MSRKQLAILLNELKTIRLLCPCGGILEASLSAMVERERPFSCPLCSANLHPPMVGDADPLRYLFMAMKAVGEATKVKVEFVVPDNGPEAVLHK